MDVLQAAGGDGAAAWSGRPTRIPATVIVNAPCGCLRVDSVRPTTLRAEGQWRYVRVDADAGTCGCGGLDSGTTGA